MYLVVLAGGLGTRYGGDKQRAVVDRRGRWLLDYTVADACAAGCERVVVVCRPGDESAVASHLRDHCPAMTEIIGVPQRADDLPLPAVSRLRPWGTGHALLAARRQLDRPFLVANADDYYGPDCFRLAADLLQDRCRPDRAGLIVYHLAQTCSPHGSVSRGVCTCDASGWLRSVKEHHGLHLVPSGVAGSGPSGPVVLPGETPVSLNAWCLHPSCLTLLWHALGDWLAAGPAEDAEFQLPTALDAVMRAGRLRVETRSCAERWLGLTYHEDHSWVAAHLAHTRLSNEAAV